MTQATRPPAAKQHTLIAGRKLGKGEFSVDIPRDLVTRHGPYKVLNPSEALLLAGICSLRPGKYVSKSRLFKAAGMDITRDGMCFLAWWRRVSSWKLATHGCPSFPIGMNSQRPNNQQPKKKRRKRLRQQPNSRQQQGGLPVL